jgi:hypothetical protein
MQPKLKSKYVDPKDITIEGMHEEKLPAIIVDLDGTLVILKRSPYNYDDIPYDALNHVVYRMLMKYHKDGYKIILLTGRPAIYGQDTMDWLSKHAVPYDMLIMRPSKNKIQDSTLKMMLYKMFVEPKFEVELVLEDRTRVVKMWRNLGLICFQVCEGDY